MIKAVLDTNIIVSATITHQGNPAQILDFLREKKFELVITPAIIQEMWRVVFRSVIKKYRKFSDEKTKRFLIRLEKSATLISPTKEVKVIQKHPADDKFVTAALEAHADYIVSGDQHLLELGYYKNIKIVSPKEFVEILEN